MNNNAGAAVYLIIWVLFFIITILKKKRQLGKVWSGSVSATLHIAGKKLICKHCEHTKFQKREGILATSLITLFHFTMWNQSACCYSCAQCGRIEWFVNPIEEKVEIQRNEPTE